jgi:3-phenylpropionate/trans-cinnamate dioxygenase ferredoxin reductase component
MASSATFVIVGAGLAGAKTAEALREQGFDGRLVLLGAEPHRPYERPPLSKSYLTGAADRESVFVHPSAWYSQHEVELRTECRVAALDRTAHSVTLTDGDIVGYTKLLLATGATPRRLPLPGADATGVHYLRSLDDSDALRTAFGSVSNLVVIGAGWIGLEVTAAARQAGVTVTVIETAELPLLRVLGPEIAEVFARLHRQHDVDLRFSTLTSAITTSGGRVTGVELHDGTVVSADAVVVAVGVDPNAALAADAGLKIDNGIVVDASLQTDDPDIFAAGDVANAFHPTLGRHVRVEHWANALHQPVVAAAAMLGQDTSYRRLPYFYTDQYDLGMEYLGHVEPGGYDRVVVRGDLEAREFIAFWLAGDRVVAGMNVNIWDVGDRIEDLITSGAPVDVARLTDRDTPLGEVTAR